MRGKNLGFSVSANLCMNDSAHMHMGVNVCVYVCHLLQQYKLCLNHPRDLQFTRCNIHTQMLRLVYQVYSKTHETPVIWYMKTTIQKLHILSLHGTVSLNRQGMEESNRFFIGQHLNHMPHGHSKEPMD